MTLISHLRTISFLLLSLSLCACGGGAGSDTPPTTTSPTTPPPSSAKPTVTAEATAVSGHAFMTFAPQTVLVQNNYQNGMTLVIYDELDERILQAYIGANSGKEFSLHLPTAAQSYRVVWSGKDLSASNEDCRYAQKTVDITNLSVLTFIGHFDPCGASPAS